MGKANSFLIASLIFLLFVTMSEVIGETPQGKDVSVDTPSPSQLLRGRPTEIIFLGKGFDTIQTIEIAPADGVTIGQAKQIDAKPEERSRGERRWSLLLTVDASAAPGERSMVVVTPEGRTKQVSFRIASHLPQISKLKVRSKNPVNAEVTFSVEVFDETGDIGTDSRVEAAIWCLESGFGIATGSAPQKIEKKGSQKSIVYGRIFRQDEEAIGSCDLEVTVVDDSGVESNKLSTKVKF